MMLKNEIKKLVNKKTTYDDTRPMGHSQNR